jgi:hypothetical protein
MTTLNLSSLVTALGAAHLYNPTTTSVEMAVGDCLVEVEATTLHVKVTLGDSSVTLKPNASLEEVIKVVKELVS